MTKQFTVYSRPDCHLCDELCGRLNQLQQEFAFEYQIVNVDSDIEYKKRYGLLIPVLTLKKTGESQEQVLCHYQLDEAVLMQYLSESKIE